MSDDFDHKAVRLAVLGMRSAFSRVLAVQLESGKTQHDLDTAGIAAVDFVNWGCALDERWCATDTGYGDRRDGDPKGRVLSGVRFVRDRHMHQVVVSTGYDDVPFFGGHGGGGKGPPFFISQGIIWRPAEEMPDPDPRHRKGEYLIRRERYVEHLQGRGLWKPLSQALDWLVSETERRGVYLPLDTSRQT